MENNQTIKVEVKSENPTITVLHGKAPEQYDPQAIYHSGNIKAPADFFASRLIENEGIQCKHLHPFNTCVAKFDSTSKSIELEIGEQHQERIVVKGQIELNPLLKQIKLNTHNSGYSIDQLRDFMFQNRNLFAYDTYQENLKSLQNYSGKITKKFDNADNKTGKTLNSIETDISDSTFTLKMSLRLFVGYPKQELDVEVYPKEQSGQIVLMLFAPKLEQLIEDEIEKEFEAQKEFFEQHIAVIES